MQSIAGCFLAMAVLSANASPAQTTTAPAAAPQAQTSPGATPPSGADLASPWQLRQLIENLTAAQQRVQSVLARLNPQQWYDKQGAPSAYIDQLERARAQLNDAARIAAQFGQRSESMPLGLDAYFRMEAFENTARSLALGARHYAPRQDAEQLDQLLAQSFGVRQRFSQYLTELAGSKEQEFRVADAEAQRCRGMISRELPARPKTKR